VHGSWTNLALMLGMEKDARCASSSLSSSAATSSPREMEHHDSAPWQEVVVDKDVNLFELMLSSVSNRGDGGFFIDKACIVSRDPDDWNNEDMETVGTYRLQVKGKNRLGIQTVPVHDIAIHLEHAEQQGKDLPIAIAVSNEPIISVAAGMSVLYGQSKYKMRPCSRASRIRWFEPETVWMYRGGRNMCWRAASLLANASPKVRLESFPVSTPAATAFRWSRSTASRTAKTRSMRLSISACPGLRWTICVRSTPARHFMYNSRRIFRRSSQSARSSLWVSSSSSQPTQVWRFRQGGGLRVMTTPHGLGYAKIVIVVDETIDPFDMKQVMWAVSTKVNPAGDVTILPNLCIDLLDPASEPPGISHRMIIDATTPVPPDRRGSFGQSWTVPQQTDEWRKKSARC